MARGDGGREHQSGRLFTFGAFGVGTEIVGALVGGGLGRDLGSIGLLLTVSAASTFAFGLLHVLWAHLWRRWWR